MIAVLPYVRHHFDKRLRTGNEQSGRVFSQKESSMSVNNHDLQFRLEKLLLTEGPEIALTHPWLSETDRWNELVFAILTQIIGGPESDIRDITLLLSDLALLHIPALAELHSDEATIDRATVPARRILEVLDEVGIQPEQAFQALTAIVEAAYGLQTHFHGKLQRYLRHYGELMLAELKQSFQFSTLSDAQVGFAFTYWLQNVLAMPLSLFDADVQAFCQLYGLQPEALIAEADKLDINLGLMDDLIRNHMQHAMIRQNTPDTTL
jgi:hypothetical protein